MKVSRKVARRSRKHTSSISRRRFRNNKNKKSGYKKRYAKTQKGGKRGRGHKRMGARTHKRGKRFHRGGENGFDNCGSITLIPLYKDRNRSLIPPNDDNKKMRRYFTTNTPTIYYTKVGSKNGATYTSSRFAMEGHSEFTIYVDFITSGDNVDLIIDFTRDPLDDKSPTFLFQIQGSKEEIRNFLINMPSLLTGNPQTESDKKYSTRVAHDGVVEIKNFPSSSRRVYSFKSPKNEATFKRIADCIKSKIPGVAAAPAPAAAAAAVPVGADDDDDPTMAPRVRQDNIKSEYIPDAIKEITQLEDDDSFQTGIYDDNPKLKFGSIKKDLIDYAKEQKTLIDGNVLFSDIQKENYKSQIDELLKLLLFAQFMFMTKLKINRYVTNKIGKNYILDFQVMTSLENMEHLTTSTKKFIENLVTGNEEANQQTYPFSNLKFSLEKFAEECKQIKEDINLTSYADFNSLVETRKNQIDADVGSPSQPS